MSIKNKLEDWANNGLITENQRQSISDFEQRNNPQNKFIFSIISLGVVVAIIGFISLIASNWQSINEYTKLSVALIILISLALSAFKAAVKEHLVLFEGLILLINLFILAFIALIGQIYNLSGPLWQILLLWSFIALPIVFLSKKTINYLITLTAMIAGSILPLINYSQVKYIYLLPISMMALMIFLREKLSLPLTKAIFISCMCLSTIIINIGHLGYSKYNWSLVSIALLMIFIYASKNISRFSKLLYSTILVFYALALISPSPNYYIFMEESILKSFSIIGFLFAIAFLFAIKNKKGCFNLTLFLIGLKFFWIYWVIFRDMIATGLGLAFSGLFIILLAWIGHKQRDQFMNLVRSYNEAE